MSNNRTAADLNFFDLADLPMLAYGIRIQHITALMCSKPEAAERLGKLEEKVKSLIPPVANHFDESDWYAIMEALYESDEWSVDIQQPPWRSYSTWDGCLCVHVGNKKWLSREPDFHRESPEVEELKAILEEMAPLPRYEDSVGLSGP